MPARAAKAASVAWVVMSWTATQPAGESGVASNAGSDVPIQHLVLGCEASEVRIGMRVRAVWAPESERPATMKAITHFEPNGEPDVDPSTFATHL